MDYEYLYLAMLFGVGAFAYYKFNKWYIKNLTKYPNYNKFILKNKSISNWILIFILIILSVHFFLKSLI